MTPIAQPDSARTVRYPFAVDYTKLLKGLSNEPIASGGYSSVYRCYLNRKLVAVKELRDSPHYPSISDIAQREYELWHRLKHPNILPLEGICYIRPNSPTPSFISYWQSNGRIKEYVRDKPESDFLHFIEGIAEAVNYLHNNDIIHGDLRAVNVLISDDHRALVTDFGIAKNDFGDGIPVSTAFQGNCRWMPCEFFRFRTCELPAPGARRSRASDIWMFAMLTQEILSGEIPFYQYRSPLVAMRMLEEGRLPEFPPAQHRSWVKFDGPVRALCLRCCTLEPEKRPTIAAILDEIRNADSLLTASSSSDSVSHMQNGADVPRSSNTREEGDDTFGLSNVFNSLHVSTNPSSTSANSSRTRCNESISRTQSSLASASQVDLDGSDVTQRAQPLRRTFGGTNGLNKGEPWLSPICPTIELDNYLARESLKSRVLEDYESSGPDELRTWYCIFRLDGKEISRAHGKQKSSAKKAAAKIALARLCGIQRTPTKHAVKSSNSSTSDTFRFEGPSHNVTWIYTLYNGGDIVEGRGKTKAEAKQNARLQLALAPSRQC